MLIRNPAIVVTVAFAAGCTATSSPARRTVTPPARSHLATTSTAPTPHSTRPAHAATADVDGDGKPDAISLRWLRHSPRTPFSGSVRLTVAFARGGSARLDVAVHSWTDARTDRLTLPSWNAGQLDGQPGQDIVIVADDTAASFTSYWAVSDHARHLVRLPAPGTPHVGLPGMWWIGGSVGTGGHGFDCVRGRVVEVTSGPGIDRVHEVRTSFVWRHDAWQRIARTSTFAATTGPNQTCEPWRDWVG